MPRPGRFEPHVTAMPGAVYSPFADRLHEHRGPLFPLHVGDTWLEPCEGARMEDLRVAEHPGLHRYGDTRGIPPLVDALVERSRQRGGAPVERGGVLVSAGATAGLAAAVGALAAPGEEVLILSPFWPLIRGIVQSLRARPVEVPFYDRVESAAEVVAAVRERLTDKSVALYVSTPSNPTGRVLPAEWLEALAELARRENLWLLSDEVYEEFVYRGEHVSLRALAPERTIASHSFSKTYGMAGNRVGWLLGPEAAIDQARKVSTHSAYHAPTAGQLAGLRALERGAEWIADAREQYRVVGEKAASLLGLPSPDGSTFLFLEVAPWLDDRGLPGLLEDCFEDGVLVAPGASAGTDYAGWIRLCYTSVPPDDAVEGVRRLAERLRARGAPL